MLDIIDIYLDDERRTPEGFVRTYSVKETIALLEKCKEEGIEVNILSLDNDLGMGVEEGYKVASWLEEQVITNNFPIPNRLVAHTANPVARDKMHASFRTILSRR